MKKSLLVVAGLLMMSLTSCGRDITNVNFDNYDQPVNEQTVQAQWALPIVQNIKTAGSLQVVSDARLAYNYSETYQGQTMSVNYDAVARGELNVAGLNSPVAQGISASLVQEVERLQANMSGQGMPNMNIGFNDVKSESYFANNSLYANLEDENLRTQLPNLLVASGAMDPATAQQVVASIPQKVCVANNVIPQGFPLPLNRVFQDLEKEIGMPLESVITTAISFNVNFQNKLVKFTTDGSSLLLSVDWNPYAVAEVVAFANGKTGDANFMQQVLQEISKVAMVNKASVKILFDENRCLDLIDFDLDFKLNIPSSNGMTAAGVVVDWTLDVNLNEGDVRLPDDLNTYMPLMAGGPVVPGTSVPGTSVPGTSVPGTDISGTGYPTTSGF